VSFLKLAVAGCLSAQAVGAQTLRIVPDADRMLNITASGDVAALFDEQELAGDPRDGESGAPITEYTNGWAGWALYYPMESIVDLGQEYQLSDVYYYDINGSDSLYMWCGNGSDWEVIFAETSNAYNSWTGHSTSCAGRYLKFHWKSPSTSVTEMVLYGTPLGEGPEPVPEPVLHEHPTFDELMGVNGFIDDDRDLLQVTNNIREYRNWAWDDGNNGSSPDYPNNLFAWSPSAVRWNGGGWDFDEYYEDLTGRGVNLQPVFQGVAPWLYDRFVGDSAKPMPIGADSTDPLSFAMHADYMYQYAARFGVENINSGLRVDAENTARSGLGLIQYMEVWNEPDKYWKGSGGYFSPQVHAALLSADYDGHMGALGEGFGIKTADSSIKVVMGGLIGFNLDYLKGMKFWADQNRDGDFPADVLNFHHYCLNNGLQGEGIATKGVSPEENRLKEQLQVLVEYRNRYLPGKELWLSEFGWDTHPESNFGAPNIGENDTYEIQGRWLVRAFLEIAAAGFDKGHQFMLRDTWDTSPGTFATSGLVHDKYDTLFAVYEKKPSWYYVNAFHKNMRNFRFESDLSVNVPEGFRLYQMSHQSQGDSVALVVWNSNDSAESVNVEIPAWAENARMVRLQEGENLGVVSELQQSQGKWLVPELNGRPVLIFCEQTVTGLRVAEETLFESSDSERDGHRVNMKGQVLKPEVKFRSLSRGLPVR
jgi:hypothetical protein